ncbi:MAG: hypothetical protein ACKVWR_00130 [Acidimicrobiales bacterium]
MNGGAMRQQLALAVSVALVIAGTWLVAGRMAAGVAMLVLGVVGCVLAAVSALPDGGGR